MHKKIIYITSFGHRYGPLSPPPTLSYDIRDIPNPPPEFRFLQRMSNDSTPLRRWLMNNEVFTSRIEVAKKDVLDLVRRIEAQRRGVMRDLIQDEVGEDRIWISVGVNCMLGRHRSVTFVEELGRRVKEELGEDDSWEVRVRHRELEKRRI